MLYPMFAFVLLIFIIHNHPDNTQSSVMKHEVKRSYYRLMRVQNRSSKQHESITIYLKYQCCSLLWEYYMLHCNIESQFAVIMAWLFVVFRALQATIHLTYNNVMHRMYMFWLANWINFVIMKSI